MLHDAPGDDFNLPPVDLKFHSGKSEADIPARSTTSTTRSGVKILVFDVIGTVVDWQGSLSAEGSELGKAKGLKADWAAFAKDWASAYGQSVHDVSSGALPWATVDELNRKSLDRVLGHLNISGLSDQEKDDLNLAWHRLKPWPDSVAGLARLRKGFVITPLSNCNRALLTDLSRKDGLPWNDIWSVEGIRRYKPDPAVYRGAAEHFHVRSDEMMMVAAHQYDLDAAKKLGMKTAYVVRVTENETNPPQPGEYDLVVSDLDELASRLGL